MVRKPNSRCAGHQQNYFIHISIISDNSIIIDSSIILTPEASLEPVIVNSTATTLS